MIIASYEATRGKDKTFGDVFFTNKRLLSNSSGDIIPKNTYNPNMKDAPISAYPHQNRLTAEASRHRLKQHLLEVVCQSKT